MKIVSWKEINYKEWKPIEARLDPRKKFFFDVIKKLNKIGYYGCELFDADNLGYVLVSWDGDRWNQIWFPKAIKIDEI